jgi:hypothetical protein
MCSSADANASQFGTSRELCDRGVAEDIRRNRQSRRKKRTNRVTAASTAISRHFLGLAGADEAPMAFMLGALCVDKWRTTLVLKLFFGDDLCSRSLPLGDADAGVTSGERAGWPSKGPAKAERLSRSSANQHVSEYNHRAATAATPNPSPVTFCITRGDAQCAGYL